MKRYAKKRDKTEPAIVEALEKIGATVWRLDTPVDLLIGYKGRTYLAECKTPRKEGGKDCYTGIQARFMEEWRGAPVATFRGIDDVFDWAKGRV